MKRQKQGGKAKSARAKEIAQETKRLVRVICKEEDFEIRRAKERQFTATVDKAIATGRIWTAEVVEVLYPLCLRLLDEQELIQAETAYWDAKLQLEETRRRLKTSVRMLA